MRADHPVLRRLITPFFVACLALTLPAALHAQTAPGTAVPVVQDQALEDKVLELSHKLRCLVCQNQSIAESNAPLAVDLRDQVREQLVAGKSTDDVLDYLVQRYGDFVLYEPPFKTTTLLLWAGPGVLLFAGAGWLVFRLRRRRTEVAIEPHLTDAERTRAGALLAGYKPAATDTPSAEEPRS